MKWVNDDNIFIFKMNYPFKCLKQSFEYLSKMWWREHCKNNFLTITPIEAANQIIYRCFQNDFRNPFKLQNVFQKLERCKKDCDSDQPPAGWIWHQNTASGKLAVLFSPCKFMCSDSPLHIATVQSLQKDLNKATWKVTQFCWFFTLKTQWFLRIGVKM